MIKSVFILGNHIQALGLVRQIKSIGLEAILFTDTSISITRFSNSVKETVLFRNENDLLLKILNKKLTSVNTLLFPTNDRMVEFLCHNYIVLQRDFTIGIPEPEITSIFTNKRNAYEFASKNSIPIPDSFMPVTLEEVQTIAKKVIYPVIIKPAVMHTFHKIFGKKAFKCDSAIDLISRVEMIIKKIPVNQLIIQEFLDGGAKELYSYGTFAVNGKSVAALMANRPRQNPMTFGNSTTYAITCNIAEIRDYAEKLIGLTGYSGLAEIEFMYDLKTNQYKFLEINTRAWKWHSISDGLGFSFIGKMISYLNYNDTSEIKDFDRKIGWIERLTDTAVVVKELTKGNNLLRDVIESYKSQIIYAVWSKKDVLPFFAYLFLSPVLFFKRH